MRGKSLEKSATFIKKWLEKGVIICEKWLEKGATSIDFYYYLT